MHVYDMVRLEYGNHYNYFCECTVVNNEFTTHDHNIMFTVKSLTA